MVFTERELLQQLETAEEREVQLEKSLHVIELECTQTLEDHRAAQQQAVTALVQRVQALRMVEKDAFERCKFEQAEVKLLNQTASRAGNLLLFAVRCSLFPVYRGSMVLSR